MSTDVKHKRCFEQNFQLEAFQSMPSSKTMKNQFPISELNKKMTYEAKRSMATSWTYFLKHKRRAFKPFPRGTHFVLFYNEGPDSTDIQNRSHRQ